MSYLTCVFYYYTKTSGQLVRKYREFGGVRSLVEMASCWPAPSLRGCKSLDATDVMQLARRQISMRSIGEKTARFEPLLPVHNCKYP